MCLIKLYSRLFNRGEQSHTHIMTPDSAHLFCKIHLNFVEILRETWSTKMLHIYVCILKNEICLWETNTFGKGNLGPVEWIAKSIYTMNRMWRSLKVIQLIKWTRYHKASCNYSYLWTNCNWYIILEWLPIEDRTLLWVWFGKHNQNLCYNWHMELTSLNILKVPVVRRFNFWVTWMQSQNMILKSILRFHKLLQGFDVKKLFLIKIDFELLFRQILCPDSQLLRGFMSKSTFHQSVIISSVTLSYSLVKNAMFYFKHFCIKIKQTG